MERSYISHFRPEVDNISGYTPGEQPREAGIIKLNTNENPYPPSPGVSKEMASFDAARLRLYPDPLATAVRAEIAAMTGFSIDSIIAGNGSDDLLTIATRCFTDAVRPMACFDPTYSLYPTLAALQGAKCIQIPLTDDFEVPDDVLKQTEEANLFIIARPNSPTGNLFHKPQIEKICAEFHGIVLIDEAYVDFSRDNCLDFVRTYPNVIVMRTFSKSRSLAGLRFGYAIAHPKIIEGMIKMKDSYNVPMLTQKLALASLWDKAYFDTCIAKVKTDREVLILGLKELNFKVLPSEANFVFAAPPKNAKNYFLDLKRRNILVRYFPTARTCSYVRISVGSIEEISVLLKTTKEILSETGSNNSVGSYVTTGIGRSSER
ncbi:MAG: Histidinol-phosphate aminotransferase [Lentisphaerae bacterium ADurb.Bin242]|nr:MAG: Histidinol-phosphate aminotransferase [Lentisphaerae bacterium ADurb.Bin242]